MSWSSLMPSKEGSPSRPLVSVVTPTLDSAGRLERCMKSVRDQTYDNVEHVVIDGGSTDGTKALLERSIVTWISEADRGQSDAINKGFALAKGEIMGWLNADDVLTDSAIERVVDAFASDPGLGWVYGDVVIDDGVCKRRERPAKVDKPTTWAARNVAAQPGTFHTREALALVGGLDESFHYMMDLDLWLRMIDAGVKARYIPEVLAIFELHGDSKSGSISHLHFLEDEARARLKSARVTSGAVALGRAAAWRVADSDDISLEGAIDELLSKPWVAGHQVSVDIIRSAAAAETAILRAKRHGVRGFGGLLAIQPWRYRETRARLRDAARREIDRRFRGKCA